METTEHSTPRGMPRGKPGSKRRPRWLVILLAVGVAMFFATAGLGVGLYVALVRGGVLNPAWTEANIDRSRDHAAQIISALAAYRDDYGVYPQRLADLTPAYIPEVPAPVAGDAEWTYGATDAGRQFVLQFSANRYDNPTSWYESRHEGWFIQVQERVEPDG